SEPVTIKVPKGATAEDVADILSQAGVIRSGLAFRVVASVRGLGASLQAGTSRLTTNMACSEVLDELEEGPPPPRTVDVTFPEGLELPEIAGVAAEELEVERRAFEQAATSGQYAL